MKAIILSAGRGSRLGADDLPKPLWHIGSRSITDFSPVSFVERQVECLRSVGVEQIGVVVGWQKERARERLAPLGVTLIENTHPDITASGTSHSFQYAFCSPWQPLDGKEPVLLMDGDIVYERRLLESVLRGGADTRIVVAPRTAQDKEEVRIYANAGRPRLIGKGLAPPLTCGLDLLGEFTGIWYVAPSDHALVQALLTWLVGVPGGARGYGFARIASEHEEMAQYLMTLGQLEAQVLAPDILFMEVDFQEDLQRLQREVYPEILRRDAA